MTESTTHCRPDPRKARGKWSLLFQSLVLLTICSKFCQAEAPIALYVGIRLADSSYATIKQITLQSLNRVYSEFEAPEVEADIDEIMVKDGQAGSWVYSYEPHFTSQFVGGQLPTNPEERELYLQFEEDIPCTVSVPAVAYLPGNIIAGIGFTDLSRIYMLNDFPHTTLFNKGMSAKYSNDLLIALGTNPAFMADYRDQFSKSTDVTSYTVEIEGKSYTAYVVPLVSNWRMVGYTHKFYTA